MLILVLDPNLFYSCTSYAVNGEELGLMVCSWKTDGLQPLLWFSTSHEKNQLLFIPIKVWENNDRIDLYLKF